MHWSSLTYLGAATAAAAWAAENDHQGVAQGLEQLQTSERQSRAGPTGVLTTDSKCCGAASAECTAHSLPATY
jgi:hypothetical protein